jgi:lysophospholipase L1-like esterase
MLPVVVGLAVASVVGATTAAAAEPPIYVALGASESLGVQPAPGVGHGVPTDHGYANDVAAAEAARWPGLRLVKLGCPGETTTTMITGDDRCYGGHLSQLSAAVDFLRHHDAVLVTIDIGFNDVRPCITAAGVDQACLDAALAAVRRNLTVIVADVRAAAPRALIVGLNKYDPFAAHWLDGTAAREPAADSIEAIERFDDVIEGVYRQDGVPVANVAQAFALGRDPAARSDLEAVARRTCQLTYMCTAPPLGPNLHPDDAGYRAMAESIAAVVSGFTKSSSHP